MRHEKHAFNLKRRLLYLFKGDIYLEDVQKRPINQESIFRFEVEMCVSHTEYSENWGLLSSVPKESYGYFIYFLERGADMKSAFKLVMYLDKLEWETSFHSEEIIKALPTLRLLITEFEAAIRKK